MPELVVHRVQVGRVRPSVLDGPRSRSRWRRARLARGLDGDEHADLVHHGGPDKAVHAYPLAHYASWAAELPSAGMEVGAFGENLTVEGVTEADICLGDRWRVGSALLEVSQAGNTGS
ncbi:MAG: MOSC domain-containing protein [Myxococcota bacterium]